MLDYETALSYEHQVYPYDHNANSEGEGGFSENFLVEEYSLLDKVHLLGAFTDTFSVIYPQAQDVDLRRIAASIEVPVFFVQGAHEARGRVQPFEKWYAQLQAPSKDAVVLGTSGHLPRFEQPDKCEFSGDDRFPRHCPLARGHLRGNGSVRETAGSRGVSSWATPRAQRRWC